MTVATEIFAERGYHDTTVNEIAARLGVGKPYIYGFFRSKEDLLSAAASQGTCAVHDAVIREAATGGSPVDILRRISSAFTRSALENHRSVQVYFRDNIYLPKKVRTELSDKRREIDRTVKSVIDRGVSEGVFDVSDSHLCSLLIAGMMSYSFAWYSPKAGFDIDHICAEVSERVVKVVL